MQTPPTYPPKIELEVLSVEYRRAALIASINSQRVALTTNAVQVRQRAQPFVSAMCAVFAWRRSLLVSVAASAVIATFIAKRLARAPALTHTARRVQAGVRWWLIARVVGRIATHFLARRSDAPGPIGSNHPNHQHST